MKRMKFYGSLISNDEECFIEFEGDKNTGRLRWLRISAWVDGSDQILTELTDLTEFRKRHPACIQFLENLCRTA